MPVVNYFDSLQGDVRTRYLSKINCIGYDPYTLDSKFYSEGPQNLPTVSYYDVMNYLIFGKSAYTEQQKRNFKSMDSYRMFVDGWVQAISFKEETDNYVIRSKVKFK